MSRSAKNKSILPVSHEVLVPVSADVDIDGVSLELLQFALKLAYMHWLMFDTPLQVTSGRNFRRCPGVTHKTGHAIDVRTNDLKQDESQVFVAVTDWLAMQHGIVRAPAPVEDEFVSMHLESKPE